MMIYGLKSRRPRHNAYQQRRLKLVLDCVEFNAYLHDVLESHVSKEVLPNHRHSEAPKPNRTFLASTRFIHSEEREKVCVCLCMQSLLLLLLHYPRNQTDYIVSQKTKLIFL